MGIVRRARSDAERALLLFLVVTGEDLAAEDPHLDADHAVGRLGLRKAVADVRAQRVQRHAPLAVPLRARDLGATDAAAAVHLDALRAHAHAAADGFLHRAPEGDAALELQRHVFGHQLGVEVGTAYLMDVDERLLGGELAELALQLLDLGALLADHDARPRRIDVDLRLVGGALDLHLGDAGVVQPFLEELAQLEVLVQQIAIIAAREPLRVAAFDDAEAEAPRMYFLSHRDLLSSALVDHHDDMRGALAQLGGAPVRARQEPFRRRPFVDADAFDVELVDIDALRVLSIGDRRLERLREHRRRLLREVLQHADGLADALAAHQIGDQTHLARRDSHMTADDARFHRHAFAAGAAAGAGAGAPGVAPLTSALRSPEWP